MKFHMTGQRVLSHKSLVTEITHIVLLILHSLGIVVSLGPMSLGFSKMTGGFLYRTTCIVMVPGLGHALAAEVAVLAEIQLIVVRVRHVGFERLFARANILAHFTNALWIRSRVSFLMLMK